MHPDITDSWQWHFKPYQVLPTRTLLLALVVLAVGLVLVSNFGLSLVSFILLAAFTWSLRLALFATEYKVNSNGIQRENLGRSQRFARELIRRVVPVPGAVFVSQHSRPSRLDRFQGWLLPLPRQHREPIISYLQAIAQQNCVFDSETVNHSITNRGDETE